MLPLRFQRGRLYINNHNIICNRKGRVTMFKRCHQMAASRFFMLTLLITFSIYYLLHLLCCNFFTVTEKEAITTELSTKSTENRAYYYKSEIQLANIVVHIDLKGFPPKFSYLESLLPKFKQLNITGLLIEYEDILFPFEGELANLSSKYAYNKTELQEFLKMVADLRFDIIPLIQTFGNMGYIQKTNENLRVLIRNMLEQVIQFHQNLYITLKYFHIGSCHRNNYEQCMPHNHPNIYIFLDHVKSITDFIKKISPETTVLMWDDMLRNISTHEWDDNENLKIEPIYWDNSPHVKLSRVTLYKYHRQFHNIWIASAYKGADNSTISLPNLKERFSNNLSWMESIQNYKFVSDEDVFNFTGIILTGFSILNSHASHPYELLPVAIPSLILNLQLIRKMKKGVLSKSNDVTDFFNKNFNDDLAERLYCSGLVDIDFFNIDQCFFEGNNLYEILNKCDTLNNRISATVDQNIQQYEKHLGDLWALEEEMIKELSRYYIKHFVAKYVNYKLKASKRILYKILRVNATPEINLDTADEIHWPEALT